MIDYTYYFLGICLDYEWMERNIKYVVHGFSTPSSLHQQKS